MRVLWLLLLAAGAMAGPLSSTSIHIVSEFDRFYPLLSNALSISLLHTSVRARPESARVQRPPSSDVATGCPPANDLERCMGRLNAPSMLSKQRF